MLNRRSLRKTTFILIIYIFCAVKVHASLINFSGKLDFVEFDMGNAVFSNVEIGSDFIGSIDDVTASGTLENADIQTTFGCCIAAGGLSINNNITLTTEEANYLNEVLGWEMFSAGYIVDIINIEGDSLTINGGRIEIGISYILLDDAFNNESVSNYPSNPAKILLTLFFIYEEDQDGSPIYSGGGKIIQQTSDSESDSGSNDEVNTGGSGGYTDRSGELPGGSSGCFIKVVTAQSI